jgi:hypothetical protein
MRIRRPDFAGRDYCKTTSTFYRMTHASNDGWHKICARSKGNCWSKSRSTPCVDEVILAIPSEGQFASREHVTAIDRAPIFDKTRLL